MKYIKQILLIFCIGCGSNQQSSVNNTTDGNIIICPGDTECHCENDNQCTSNLCSPVNTCTNYCMSDSDCQLIISGESCIVNSTTGVGMCGVMCDVYTANESGGCQQTGMTNDVTCSQYDGIYICNYIDVDSNKGK